MATATETLSDPDAISPFSWYCRNGVTAVTVVSASADCTFGGVSTGTVTVAAGTPVTVNITGSGTIQISYAVTVGSQTWTVSTTAGEANGGWFPPSDLDTASFFVTATGGGGGGGSGSTTIGDGGSGGGGYDTATAAQLATLGSPLTSPTLGFSVDGATAVNTDATGTFFGLMGGIGGTHGGSGGGAGVGGGFFNSGFNGGNGAARNLTTGGGGGGSGGPGGVGNNASGATGGTGQGNGGNGGTITLAATNGTDPGGGGAGGGKLTAGSPGRKGALVITWTSVVQPTTYSISTASPTPINVSSPITATLDQTATSTVTISTTSSTGETIANFTVASGQTVSTGGSWTPLHAGSSTLTFTNGSSLTNPSPQAVVVTSAATGQNKKRIGLKMGLGI